MNLRLPPLATPVKSLTDQIFNSWIINERGKEYRIQTNHSFINFKSVYNSTNRQELFRTLEELSVYRTLIKLNRPTTHDWSGTNLVCKVKHLNLPHQVDFKTSSVLNHRIQTTGTIFNRTVQLHADTDNIEILERWKSEYRRHSWLLKLLLNNRGSSEIKIRPNIRYYRMNLRSGIEIDV